MAWKPKLSMALSVAVGIVLAAVVLYLATSKMPSLSNEPELSEFSR